MLHQPITTCATTPSTSLAEILGAFSYALDITEGQPAGHSVRSCFIGSRIGRELGLGARERHEFYYTLLLKDLGCSSNAARICELYEADDRAFKHGYKTVGTSLAATSHFVFSRTAAGAPLHRPAGLIGNILKNGDSIAQEMIVSRCSRGAISPVRCAFPKGYATASTALTSIGTARAARRGCRAKRSRFMRGSPCSRRLPMSFTATPAAARRTMKFSGARAPGSIRSSRRHLPK